MALEIFRLLGTVAISKEQALKDIKSIQAQAEKTSTAMGKSFTKFSGYVEKHSAQIKKAGKYLTVFGGIATAAFAVSVKSAANFEEQLANVSTMLDESAMKILPEYRKGLQSLSVEFGESTETLSKGLYDILSASIPPAEALSVLEVSAKAAAAGITDTGVAADAITTILNSYGMSADQAGMVSDKLFAIVREGKTNFAELAPSIGKVAATASMAGLDFDDLGASIATMTRAGIRTEETMTAINGVLIAFLKPTDEAKEAAAKFGLELNSNTLRTEGLTGVMEKLTDATAEQLAEIFPNIRGLKGMAAALGDAEGYAKSYALMLDSAGLTQEAFAKQSDTLNFKLNQLKAAFNIIKVTVGDVLIPPIMDLTTKAIEIIRKVKDWTEANKPLTETIVKWGAGISVALLVLGPLLIMLPGLIASLGFLKIAFIPFLVGAAIYWGLDKLVEKMRDLTDATFLTRKELKEIDLSDLIPQIEALEKELEEVEEARKKFVDGYKDAWWKAPMEEGLKWYDATIKDLTDRLEKMEVQREILTIAEEEGREVTAERLKLDKEIAAIQDEIKEKMEAERIALEEKVKAEEIANAEKDLGLKIYELSHTAMENSIRLLDEEKQRLIELGIEKKLIDEWYDLEIKRLEELYKKETEVVDVTKLLSLEMQILTAQYKLTNQTEEITIKYYEDMLRVSEEIVKVKKAERDSLEEGTLEYKEANLVYLEARINAKDLKETINELNQVRNEELEGLELVRAKLDLQSKQYQVTAKDADYYKDRLGLLGEEHEILAGKITDLKDKGEEWTDGMVKAKGELYANEEATEALKEELIKLVEGMSAVELEASGLMPIIKALGIEFEEAAKSAWEEWKEFFDNLKEKYGTTMTILQDGISGFVSSFEGALSNAITSLFTMAETNAKIKEDMAKLEEEYLDEMATLQEEYNQAVIAGDDAAAENALQNIADLKEEHEQAMQDMSDDMVTKKDIWDQFWKDIKTAAINALAEIIAKQAISALLSMGWVGWAILGIAFIAALASQGMALGGEVAKQVKDLGIGIGYDLGGLIKGLQLGGGTDTVLIRATPGEYVVSKPMTDFIKRTGIVTSDLINAIRMGTRTPTPSFAVGGTVPSIISNPTSNQVNIEGVSISIFAQELNDETIANAGDKIFVELKKQFGMRGLTLMEE